MELKLESIPYTAVATPLGVLARRVLSLQLTHGHPKQSRPVGEVIKGLQRTRTFVHDIALAHKSESEIVPNCQGALD